MISQTRRWTTVYKLTDAHGQTRNDTQWAPGVTNPCGIRDGLDGLCSASWYHWYHTPELAVLLNPIGADFDPATCRLWEAEARGRGQTDNEILKGGSTELRTVREIACPRPTLRQRTAFGILVAGATLAAVELSIPEWETWALAWLDGSARSAAWSAARSAAVSAASAAIILDASVLALAEPWDELPPAP